MYDTLKLPDFLSAHKANIQEGLAGEKGTDWNIERWLKHFGNDVTISTDLDAIWRRSPKVITRNDVKNWAPPRDSTDRTAVRRLFLASMIWGWGNRGIGIQNAKRSLSSPNAEELLEKSLELVKNGEIAEAYKRFFFS